MVQVFGAKVVETVRRCIGTAHAETQRICRQTAARARVWWVRLVVVAALARQLRRRLVVSVGVGMAVGLVAYLAGPVVVPLAFGLVGFAASMMAGVWEPLRSGTTMPEVGG